MRIKELQETIQGEKKKPEIPLQQMQAYGMGREAGEEKMIRFLKNIFDRKKVSEHVHKWAFNGMDGDKISYICYEKIGQNFCNEISILEK